MKRLLVVLLFATLVISCAAPVPAPTVVPVQLPDSVPLENSGHSLTGMPSGLVPDFEHVFLIILENEGFDTVIGNPDMPVFNSLAQENSLMTEFHAVRHPSLPNYIALIGGDTFGIDRDCYDCYIDAPSLPDLIEDSGRSWKTYQEDMPGRCYPGRNLIAKLFKNRYVKKHNPFVYFDPIRLDQERCERSVVPLTELYTDMEASTLPNFAFITPNMCNIGHDCSMAVVDQWLDDLLGKLIPALDGTAQPYLVVLTFDEGKGNQSCCGLTQAEGGRIAVVLMSPAAKNSFEDDTPYNHYSLLKTIAEAWGLEYLGHAADEETMLITAPWK